jgi:uncharacterized Zn finger protein (UPF0148 family)
MSDADDGFDREAERQKLEEKYGDDAEQRESTQRMSELLLKGATMTNKHCDNCGDPLFRQNGQVFCPSCSADGEANAQNGAKDDSEAGGTQSDDGRSDTEQTSPPEAGRRPTERQPAEPQQSAERQQSATPQQSPERQQSATPQQSAEPRQSQSAEQQPPQHRSTTQQTATQQTATRQAATQEPTTQRSAPQQPAESVQSGGDLATARESLVAAVTEQARLGTAADDPRTAADHFAAAREAAETLAALRR